MFFLNLILIPKAAIKNIVSSKVFSRLRIVPYFPLGW